ncbi:hypothetical protein M8818_002031 [Zalaria obscura]|uniref:Uncharacterized protein n=1 Tax=Zalaria obscura TaxID=2024903 RepID=A0ACC3SJE3_9PEZI
MPSRLRHLTPRCSSISAISRVWGINEAGTNGISTRHANRHGAGVAAGVTQAMPAEEVLQMHKINVLQYSASADARLVGKAWIATWGFLANKSQDIPPPCRSAANRDNDLLAALALPHPCVLFQISINVK